MNVLSSEWLFHCENSLPSCLLTGHSASSNFHVIMSNSLINFSIISKHFGLIILCWNSLYSVQPATDPRDSGDRSFTFEPFD